MFHNGTISGLGNTIKSDSQVLADRIAQCDFKFVEDIQPLILPYVDDKINRLVFFEDNGRITIINKHLGMVEDGIWYSNDYHKKDSGWCRGGVCAHTNDTDFLFDDELYKVFVYGTLKRGYRNHGLLENSTYLGKAKTTKKMAMISNESNTFPYVLGVDEYAGEHIEGEVYLVDETTKDRLDLLEGVPHHYYEDVVEVEYIDDGLMDDVSIYVKTFASEELFSKPKLKVWKE